MALSANGLAGRGLQIENGIVLVCDGLGLKNMLQAGERWLAVHLNIVNDLNVFPVPDGDTGTNMLLTMRSALKEMEGIVAGCGAGSVAAAAAHGALMGARGNSGVILSQFLEGLAISLAGQDTFTADDFARATQMGAEKAYQGMVKPVEGTILTVARRVAEAAQQSVKANKDLLALLRDMVQMARIAQAETPEFLPLLKEAGVTDAGGQGLFYILEGAFRFMNEEPVDIEPVSEAVPLWQSTLNIEKEAYGYDVQFLIQGNHLNVEDIRAFIDSVGWSTIVVGTAQTVKVHVHTHDPGIPISYGASRGILSDVVVENMEEQAKRFVREHTAEAVPLPSPALPVNNTGKIGEALTNTAIVCIAPGQGWVHIFQSLGASQVLSGGQTMNPSTEELLAVINRVEADNVLVLPNNNNIILAAQQAQALSLKNTRVVATKTMPQGIAALLSFNFQTNLELNAQHMLEAAQKVQTIEISRAGRDVNFNGFQVKRGDVIGLLNNTLVSVGQDFDDLVLDVLSKVASSPRPPDAAIPESDSVSVLAYDTAASGLAQTSGWSDYEIVTIYFGKDSTEWRAWGLAQKVNRLYPELKVEVLDGGQPHYHYIISLE